MILKSEEGVNLLQGTEEEATSVGSALFVGGRDLAKLGVPCVDFFVAALIFLSSYGVLELTGRSVSVSVDQLSDTMS